MKKFTTECVGMQHRLTMSTRRMMRARIAQDGPIAVLLIREHENVHDENAIKVQVREAPYKGMHIGYLPRAVASVYAPALDEMEVRVHKAHLTDVTPDEGIGTLRIMVKGKKSR